MKEIMSARGVKVVFLPLSTPLFLTACPPPDVVVRSMGFSGPGAITLTLPSSGGCEMLLAA